MSESTQWPTLRRNLIDYGRLLHAISFESQLLLDTAEETDGRFPVPSYPGLTVAETVRLTASAYRRALEWIRAGEPPDEWQQAPASDESLSLFHLAARTALVAELAAHDPDESCDTWWPADRTFGFWRRRLAHETAVRRVDVQGAAGVDIVPVQNEFAVDGIDEVLLLWFGHKLYMDQRAATTEGAVGVQAAGRSWLAVLGRNRCSARRVPAVDAAAADALVTGEAMNVYLWLWGRVPHRLVTITGDYDASAQLWALLRTTTP
jgi:Mycothiol maleylpyruvate isomerase N-terminal domain